MSDIEHYEDWLARIKREGTPDPPAIFAGNWARKYIEELEEERDALRQQLAGAVERLAEAERLLEQVVNAHCHGDVCICAFKGSARAFLASRERDAR